MRCRREISRFFEIDKMLNRRTLRIKAFKNLYALENLRMANENLAREQVERAFEPDLNSMTPQDPELLKAEKEKALKQFDQLMKQKGKSEKTKESIPVYDIVEKAVESMIDNNRKDQERLEKALFSDVENVKLGQFFIFQLLDDLAFQNKKLVEERKELEEIMARSGNTSQKKLTLNFYNNRALKKLTASPVYQDAMRGKGAFRIEDPNILRDWFKGILLKDPEFNSYNEKAETTYRDDWKLLDYLVRQIIFTREEIVDHLSEQDINWFENRPVVKSLAVKTLKSIQEEENETEFAEFSYNWEDDSEFLKKLYRFTANDTDYLEGIIKNNLENWDINRIALTDKVILKTAISEMVNFPSIPVKVTINEYIELSKIYSTPKSRKFINGILDVISDKLSKEKVIRKSGRGLIDNK